MFEDLRHISAINMKKKSNQEEVKYFLTALYTRKKTQKQPQAHAYSATQGKLGSSLYIHTVCFGLSAVSFTRVNCS